jgi:hypothetical protein
MKTLHFKWIKLVGNIVPQMSQISKEPKILKETDAKKEEFIIPEISCTPKTGLDFKWHYKSIQEVNKCEPKFYNFEDDGKSINNDDIIHQPSKEEEQATKKTKMKEKSFNQQLIPCTTKTRLDFQWVYISQQAKYFNKIFPKTFQVKFIEENGKRSKLKQELGQQLWSSDKMDTIQDNLQQDDPEHRIHNILIIITTLPYYYNLISLSAKTNNPI